MWFSFDGCDLETHETPEEAKNVADAAMDNYRDSADGDTGWAVIEERELVLDDLSLQVCWGRIAGHAQVTSSRDPTESDNPDFFEYRCNIYGGVVFFDGTAPTL